MADTATIVDFALPSLGSDMEAGTVIEWLVAVGDTVRKGDVLVRVDTEKADIDVEVWHDGLVVELLVDVGVQVPVGTTLARLEAGSDAKTPAAQRPTAEVDKPTELTPTTSPSQLLDALIIDDEPQPKAQAGQAQPASQAVSPKMVYWPSSTTRQVQPPGASPTRPDQAQPSRAERRQAAVASLMEQSNREIPHFHVTRQIDLTASLEALAAHNDAVEPRDRVLPAAMMLHAVAHAASASPINGTTDAMASSVDLGVAVHLRGGGLVTPVIPEADTLSLTETMRELKDLVARARSGRMTSRDATEATLTVTNLGDTGADRVLGIIRPPQRALVGFGTIADRAAVVDGEIVARATVDATLTADHRVVNGHAAARFLASLDVYLGAVPDRLNQGESA